MGKYGLSKDEWYPVYGIEDDTDWHDLEDVELSDEFVARYRMALKEWDWVQVELHKAACARYRERAQ